MEMSASDMDALLVEMGDYNMSMFFEQPSYTPGISSSISITVTALITFCILITNLVFMLTIMTSQSLRRKPSHWLLLNLSFADLVFGVVVTPLAVYYEWSDNWDMGTGMCLIWIFSGDFLPCVSILATVMINIDRLIYVRNPMAYDSELRKPCVLMMMAIAWLAAGTIVFPLFFIGRLDGFERDIPNMCYAELSKEYAFGISAAAFFAPVCVITLMNIAILVSIWSTKKRLRRISMVVHSNGTNGKYYYNHRCAASKVRGMVTALTVVNIFHITMHMPRFVFSTIVGAGSFSLISPTLNVISIWLSYANAGLNPVLWLIYPDISRKFGQLVCCYRKHKMIHKL